MKHYRMMKKIVTFLLLVTVVGTNLLGNGYVKSVQAQDDQFIYFLNTEGWQDVGAYVYGDKGEVLGSWGTATATAAPEIGSKWLKVGVTEMPPYSIVFYNKEDDKQRTELYIDSVDKVYVAANRTAWTSYQEAETAMGITYDVYFLNTEGWAEVGAHAYNADEALTGSWGTTTATSATELGSKWVKISLTTRPPYSVIFFNKAKDAERTELTLGSEKHIYVTMGNVAYTTSQEAEEAMASYDIYFLNSEGWTEVGAHAYNDDGTLTGDWGTTIATSASELGDGWLKISLKIKPPYSVIFFNKENDTERTELKLESENHIYVTMGNVAYTTQDDAEKAMNIYCSISIDGLSEKIKTGATFVLPDTAEYGYYCDGQMYKPGTELTVTKDMDFTSVNTLSVSVKQGAGVRYADTNEQGELIGVTEHPGLRFQATITSNNMDALKAQDAITEGMLITAEDLYIANGTKLDLDTVNKIEGNSKYYPGLNIANSGWYNNVNGSYCGSIVNILKANYSRKFIARAYVTISYTDDTTITIYSEMSDARSIQYVAQEFMNDADGKYEGLDNAYKALIQDFAAAV